MVRRTGPRIADAIRRRRGITPLVRSLKTVHRTVFFNARALLGFKSREYRKRNNRNRLFLFYGAKDGTAYCLRNPPTTRHYAACPLAENSPQDCFFNARALLGFKSREYKKRNNHNRLFLFYGAKDGT